VGLDEKKFKIKIQSLESFKVDFTKTWKLAEQGKQLEEFDVAV
jgi:hypothetical protein